MLVCCCTRGVGRPRPGDSARRLQHADHAFSHGTLRQVLQSGTDDQALQPAATVYFALYLVQRGRFLEATLALKAVAELQGTFSLSPVFTLSLVGANQGCCNHNKAPSCMCEASAWSLQAPSTASGPMRGGASQCSN